jgi:hypothetical protein
MVLEIDLTKRSLMMSFLMRLLIIFAIGAINLNTLAINNIALPFALPCNLRIILVNIYDVSKGTTV